MNILIETSRLILREFVEEDAEAIFEFGSNPKVQQYTGNKNLTSIEEASELIKEVWFKDYATYGYGRWAVIYKPHNKLIGFAGLKYLPEIKETDIGFRFLPEYWNQGIATEASKKIILYGFEVLKLKRIIGIAMKENIGSHKVLKKIGLTHYKEGEYDGDGEIYDWYEVEQKNYLK